MGGLQLWWACGFSGCPSSNYFNIFCFFSARDCMMNSVETSRPVGLWSLFITSWSAGRPLCGVAVGVGPGWLFRTSWWLFMPSGRLFVPSWRLFRASVRLFGAPWRLFMPSGRLIIPPVCRLDRVCTTPIPILQAGPSLIWNSSSRLRTRRRSLITTSLLIPVEQYSNHPRELLANSFNRWTVENYYQRSYFGARKASDVVILLLGSHQQGRQSVTKIGANSLPLPFSHYSPFVIFPLASPPLRNGTL